VIRIVAPGFEPMVDTVVVSAGEQERMVFVARSLASEAPPPPREEPVAAATTPPAAQPAGGERGVLQIRISPWANVSIDGVSRGPKPGVVDTLLPGAHSIRLERDGFVPVDTVVNVRPGEATRVNFRMVPRSDE
jgi:hypothetical protein